MEWLWREELYGYRYCMGTIWGRGTVWIYVLYGDCMGKGTVCMDIVKGLYGGEELRVYMCNGLCNTGRWREKERVRFIISSITQLCLCIVILINKSRFQEEKGRGGAFWGGSISLSSYKSSFIKLTITFKLLT